jgi:RNA polymerase sigma factor (sigma-70 family)
MTDGLQVLIARTRLLAGLSKARALNDRQLLQQYAGGDESAFTALVDRYGGLVLSVCQRVLKHTQDSEDAFQATFMVLARKADTIAWKESVANWLHGVACRISFQIRRKKMRRPARDVATDEPAVAGPDPAWSELKPVLDEELDRLPAKYRIPLILCCLEGKSRDEAAAQLGWSVGSVKGRLERGREILRTRLARRGLALSAALAATLMTAATAKAAVPLTLGLATVRAGMAMLGGQAAGIVSSQVLTLTQGAIQAMFMTKLKFAAAVLMTVVTLGLGTGYVTQQILAGNGAVESNLSPIAQREGRKEEPRVNGIVQAVDAAKQTINVVIARDDPDGQTYEVAKGVKVVLREGRETKAGKFADVQPKARVSLLLDDAKKIVQTIEILGERGGRESGGVHGILAEVDAAKRTITLQTGGRGEAPTSTVSELAKDAKVVFRTGRLTKQGTLADLELKKPLTIFLDDTKKVVKSIEVTISTTANGAVSEVDVAKNTITLLIGGGRGSDPKSETYELVKDVKVYYRLPTARERGAEASTKALKLADLAVKTNVTLQLDDTRKTVQSIDVQLPTVRGTLQAVDADKRTLTMRPARGDDVSLEVAKDAKILVDGKDSKLDSVKAAVEVHLILSPDRARVLALQTPPPAGR